MYLKLKKTFALSSKGFFYGDQTQYVNCFRGILNTSYELHGKDGWYL